MSRRQIPAFATEAEEAQWWFDHRAETAKDLLAASKEGKLGPGSIARRKQKLAGLASSQQAESAVVPFHLDEADAHAHR